MKKLTIVFILFLSILSFGQKDLTKKTFSNKEFSFKYPKNWTLDTSKVNGTEFAIFSALENKADNFKENVNGIIQNLEGQNIDLKRYKEITEKQIAEMNNENEIISSEIKIKDSKSYYEISYVMKYNDSKLKAISICYIKQDKAYLLTFTALFDKYDFFAKDGLAILNSFKMLKK